MEEGTGVVSDVSEGCFVRQLGNARKEGGCCVEGERISVENEMNDREIVFDCGCPMQSGEDFV